MPEAVSTVANTEPTPANVVFAAVSAQIKRMLDAPLNDAHLAEALAVSTTQAKAGLNRLVSEGVIEKQKKPAGYILKRKRLIE